MDKSNQFSKLSYSPEHLDAQQVLSQCRKTEQY